MKLHINKLQVGDIVGTTSYTPLAWKIKAKTWGWRKMFSVKHCSHIATVVDRGKGLLYFAEMAPKGIVLTEMHKYAAAPNYIKDFICFVGRCPVMSPTKKEIYNDTILTLHSRKVKYGYEDLFNYVLESIGIELRDNENTLICSELPRVGFKSCDIEYPSSWEKRCSPADWQQFVGLYNITKEVIS